MTLNRILLSLSLMLLLSLLVAACGDEPGGQSEGVQSSVNEPGTYPTTEPGATPGTTPSTDPGTAPGTDPGTDPGTNPGSNPGSNPGTDPGSNPGTDPGSNPGTDPGPGTVPGPAACTLPGEVCVTVSIPANFPGGADRLAVNFFSSLPPMGPPAAMGTEIVTPELVAGSTYPVKMNGVSATGTLYIYVVAYMPGGGPWMPIPGIDWVGQSGAVVMDGSAINISQPILIQKVSDGSEPGTDPGAVEGACTNDADMTVLENNDIAQIVEDATMGCVGDADPGACVATATSSQTGLSAPCATCFGEQVTCVIQSCLVECMADSSTPSCVSCRETNCTPIFEPCSGLEVEEEPSTNPGTDPGTNPGANPGTNPGTGVSGPVPTFTRVTLFDGLAGAAWITPADLDGDGFDELLLSTLSEGLDFASMPPLANGGAYILSRDGGAPQAGDGVGSWSAQMAFDQTAGYGFPNNSSLYDVDNDGIEDWVIAGGFLAKPTGYILWMKGEKNGGVHSFGAISEIEIPDSSRWYHEIAPIDLDGDGDIDFITTNNNTMIEGFGGLAYGTSKLEWFENMGIPGEASFIVHTIADVGGALFNHYDIDEDGDEDLIIPQFFGGASLIWMENPGNPFDLWDKHIINDTTGKGFGVEIVDLDGDGQMELLYGNHNHQGSAAADETIMGIYWFDIPASDTLDTLANWDADMNVLYEGFYVPATDPEQEGAPGVVRAGDIDGDGDLDVTASGDGDKGIYLFVQQEVGEFQLVQLDNGQTMSGDHVMMDLDADGDMDYVWCVFGEAGLSGVQSYIYAYLQDEIVEAGPATDPGNGTGTGAIQIEGTVNDFGPWDSTTTSATLNVPGGLFGTNIPLTLFIPQGDGPFPVVVMTDGFNLAGDLYTSYGDHLASWGFVVVFADIPNNIIFSKTAVELADYLSATFDWIEANADGPFQGKADMERLAVAGHSAGGKAAIHVSLYDGRPSAVFAIDPVDSAPPFGGNPEDYPSIAPELMDLLDVPVVLVGETTNGGADGAVMTPCAPAEENFQQYYAAAVGPALEIEFIGASHMSFLDNPNCGLDCSVCPAGTDDPTVTRVLTQGYMVAFFRRVLEDEAEYTTYLTGAAMTQNISAGLVAAQWKNGF